MYIALPSLALLCFNLYVPRDGVGLNGHQAQHLAGFKAFAPRWNQQKLKATTQGQQERGSSNCHLAGLVKCTKEQAYCELRWEAANLPAACFMQVEEPLGNLLMHLPFKAQAIQGTGLPSWQKLVLLVAANAMNPHSKNRIVPYLQISNACLQVHLRDS